MNNQIAIDAVIAIVMNTFALSNVVQNMVGMDMKELSMRRNEN